MSKEYAEPSKYEEKLVSYIMEKQNFEKISDLLDGKKHFHQTKSVRSDILVNYVKNASFQSITACHAALSYSKDESEVKNLFKLLLNKNKHDQEKFNAMSLILDSKNGQNKSPMRVAWDKGFFDVVRFLFDKGAKIPDNILKEPKNIFPLAPPPYSTNSNNVEEGEAPPPYQETDSQKLDRAIEAEKERRANIEKERKAQEEKDAQEREARRAEQEKIRLQRELEQQKIRAKLERQRQEQEKERLKRLLEQEKIERQLEEERRKERLKEEKVQIELRKARYEEQRRQAEINKIEAQTRRMEEQTAASFESRSNPRPQQPSTIIIREDTSRHRDYNDRRGSRRHRRDEHGDNRLLGNIPVVGRTLRAVEDDVPVVGKALKGTRNFLGI